MAVYSVVVALVLGVPFLRELMGLNLKVETLVSTGVVGIYVFLPTGSPGSRYWFSYKMSVLLLCAGATVAGVLTRDAPLLVALCGILVIYLGMSWVRKWRALKANAEER